MKVEKLSLANFRGFEQINLEFEDDVTVIAGVNGVGKSGVLQALATLTSYPIQEITPIRTKKLSLSEPDIHENEDTAIISAHFSIESQNIETAILNVRESLDTDESAREKLRTLPLRKEEATREGDEEKLQELKVEERYFKNLLSKNKQYGSLQYLPPINYTKQQLRNLPHHPIALLFSPQRQLVKEVRKLSQGPLHSLTSAYRNALESRPLDLGHFLNWYRVQEKLGTQRQKTLADLRTVVTEFIPDFKTLRVETEPKVRFIVEKNSLPLALTQLSDGERGLLAVIFDLTSRLSIANPDLENPIADGKAIVLIDEIELHLHPKWQRQVLRRLTSTFKNCQFIVTTHSPQVLGEVESRCIRLLYCEDNKVKSWIPDRSKGLDSSRILEELMDVNARNIEIETALKQLAEQIDDENFELAKQSIQELSKTLGENDPELTRAKALMTFLEAGE